MIYGKGSSNWLWSICVYSVDLQVVVNLQKPQNKQINILKQNKLKQKQKLFTTKSKTKYIFDCPAKKERKED